MEPLGRTSARPRWAWALPAVMIAALMTTGVAWAFASHQGSAPDDDFHLASIWCAWGRASTGCELDGYEKGKWAAVVPALEEALSTCTKFKPSQSAACIAEDGPDAEPAAPQANAGAYPSGYYSVARLFVRSATIESILTIRIMTFIVCAGLIVAAGLILRSRDRWAAWWYVALLLVPLGWFLFASTNPSGPAIAGAAAVAAAGYAIGQSDSRARSGAAALLGVFGVLIAGGSRPDGWQFAGFALGLGALASVQSPADALRRARLLPWGAVIAALLLAWSASGGVAPGGIGTGTGTGESAATGGVTWFEIFLDIPALYVGEFPTLLGWLDTQSPPITWGLCALVIGGLIILGLADFTLFRAAAILLGFALLVLVPLAMHLALNKTVGNWVQPRYLLPLVLTVGLLLAVRPSAATQPKAGPVACIASMAIVAHCWALHQTIQRSVTGLDVTQVRLSDGKEWWWASPLGPGLVWWAGSAAFAALVAALSWRLLNPSALPAPLRRDVDGPAPSGVGPRVAPGSVREAPG